MYLTFVQFAVNISMKTQFREAFCQERELFWGLSCNMCDIIDCKKYGFSCPVSLYRAFWYVVDDTS